MSKRLLVRKFQFLMWLLYTGTSAKGHQVPTTVGTPVQSDSASSREPGAAPPVATEDRASPGTHELGNTLAIDVEISGGHMLCLIQCQDCYSYRYINTVQNKCLWINGI
jgi:hypothetical protein